MEKLFGRFTYETQEELDQFMLNLTHGQAVTLLVTAAAVAEGKGVFNKHESHLLARSIRKLTEPELPFQDNPPKQ